MTKHVLITRHPGGYRFVVTLLVLASLLLAPLPNGALASSPKTERSGLVPCIVALRVEADVEEIVRDYHLQPLHRYARKLNGFSARLDAATAARLQADRRVAALQPEKEAFAIVLLGSQTDPAAIAREFGLRPSHFYTKALKGFLAPMNGDQIAQLEADKPGGSDKRMRILSVGLDGGAKQIVTLRRDADPDAVARETGLKPYQIYKHAMKGFAAAMTSGALAKLDTDARVVAVEPDGKIVLCGQTYSAGLVRMQIPGFPVSQLAVASPNFTNIGVAVMDSGIQLNHPNLNVCGNAGFVGIAEGSPGYNGDDWEGHGTQVAGVIGAFGNPIYDGYIISGVAPGVCLYSVQVVGPNESAWSNFISGADYIVQNAQFIDVVNASISGLAGPASAYTAVHEAVLGIVNEGIVFVAAAGNDAHDIAGTDRIFGTPDDYMPAALPEVMAVGAMDPNPTKISNGTTSSNPTYNQIWGLSNYSTIPNSPSYVNSPGLAIDVTAPGVNIPSTAMGGTFIATTGATTTGTSFASPYAAGLVVDYIAANGRGNTFQDVINIRQAIVNSAQPQTAWSTYPNVNNYGGPPPLAIPSISWVPAPQMTYAATQGGLQVGFNSVPGYDYTLQASSALNLTSANWSALGSPVVGSSVDTNGNPGRSSITDPSPPASGNRFYRVVMTPE